MKESAAVTLTSACLSLNMWSSAEYFKGFSHFRYFVVLCRTQIFYWKNTKNISSRFYKQTFLISGAVQHVNPALSSRWLCKEEGRPNWQTERALQWACPEQSIVRSRRRDSPTSSACGAAAPTVRLHLPLPRLCFSVFGVAAAQRGTVHGALRRARRLPPPVPAILERPAIGGKPVSASAKRCVF